MFNPRIITIFIGFLCCINTISSQVNTDSLIKEFEKLPNDTHSVNTLISYAFTQKKINLDLALIGFKIAYAKSKEINDKHLISKSAIFVGSTYLAKSDFENASTFLYEGQKYAESIGDNRLLLKVKLTLGNMYSTNGQTKKAMEMYEQALKLADEKTDEASLAAIYNNFGGIIYTESKSDQDRIKSIWYYRKSIDILEKAGIKAPLAIKYCNLGLVYSEVSQYDSALFYLNKAKIIIDEHKLPDDLVTYYCFVGRVYTGIKDFNKAEQSFLNAAEESKKLNNPEWVATAYLGLSDMYLAQKDYSEALWYSNIYHQIKDSIVNVTNFAKAADIQNKFEREKKEIELEKLKGEQAKNRIINLALIAVSVLLIISGAMMYSRFKIKSQSEKQLKRQNEIIKQKNKDITASIRYAKRIQTSLLPTEKYIERNLTSLKKINH